ncbi:nucleotidyl transferase AbiEii/AbiGii toxin family protein [Ectothiorhodospiraceae bacterium 2226]|nr:nucleotidyl transferase AbiEii/AbiGii toxin family protein [Ectothiorhodospiraceae bacterium 2226]
MRADDPNVVLVEAVAGGLGDLCEELVFVGGCAVSLLMDSPSAAPARVTHDVDLVVKVVALPAYYALERELERSGFKRDDDPDAPICRWRLGEVMVDVMPSDPTVLGFSNRWYATVVSREHFLVRLPSGRGIRLISAPGLLATKFEAFRSRGKSDALQSHDLEDIINIIEARRNIIAEVGASDAAVREYIKEQVADLVQDRGFAHALPGLITFDDIYQDRLDAVRGRLAALAQLENGGSTE